MRNINNIEEFIPRANINDIGVQVLIHHHEAKTTTEMLEKCTKLIKCQCWEDTAAMWFVIGKILGMNDVACRVSEVLHGSLR